MKTVKASEFKAKCLRLMDEVEETGEPVVITKNGRPVAQLGPVVSRRKTLAGLHKGQVRIVGDITRSVHTALALNDLAHADGYTLKHSLAVTTLGLSLGLRVMRKYGWIDAYGSELAYITNSLV